MGEDQKAKPSLINNAVSDESDGTAKEPVAIPFHPLADMFPAMEGKEFQDLLADIEANGLLAPIMIYEGQILDGRNRYRACVEAGIKLKTEPFEGSEQDARAFVISANVRRRHLTGKQKQALIKKLLLADPEQSDRQVAEAAKTDHKTAAAARKKMERGGEIPHHKKRTDKRGRKQPATKKPSAKKFKPAAASRQDREPRSAGLSAKTSALALAEFGVSLNHWFAKMTQDDRLKAVELVLNYKGIKVS